MSYVHTQEKKTPPTRRLNDNSRPDSFYTDLPPNILVPPINGLLKPASTPAYLLVRRFLQFTVNSVFVARLKKRKNGLLIMQSLKVIEKKKERRGDRKRKKKTTHTQQLPETMSNYSG